ncbi:MAG: DsbC family protein [Xanthomonadales bacterium]|nr:DsbC family protein [Xanthomonadales bacterium]
MKQWQVLALALVAGAAQADEAAVRAAVQRLLPNAAIESVQPAAMADVFEVVANGEVVYVSADGEHLLQGRLYDARQRTDLTASTENGLRRAALSKVGEEKRIRFAAADEKHRITIFTDVDCGYCRKLHKEMSAINAAGITVDYLMFPRAGQPSASFDKAAFVWCAADRQEALTASMLSGELDAAKRRSCAHPITDTMKLGQRLARLGTPTIIASDGAVLGGYLEPAQLVQRLASVKEAPAQP